MRKGNWLLAFGPGAPVLKELTGNRSYSSLLALYCLLLAAYSLLLTPPLQAQTNIPVGTWRLHLSYNTIKSVALGDDKVFGASESGILIFDRADNSISSLSTLNGLSGTGISTIAYDQQHSQLLVAYTNGDLDILKNNTVINFNRLKNSSTITGSKKINHITINGQSAYLATDYGIVVFDLNQLDLKETWRDLGVNGVNLKVKETMFRGDSIFIATASGVLAGDVDDNLLDFNNWKRYDTGDLASSVQSIAAFNATIYAAINGKGIFRYENGSWTKENFLQNQNFNSLYSSESGLLVAGTTDLFRLTTSGDLLPVENDLITSPLSAMEDAGGKLWVGDQSNGLISDIAGNLSSYLPNGPSVNQVSRLRSIHKNGRIVLAALPGGYSSAGQSREFPGALQLFEDGQWKTELHPLNDLTDIEIFESATFLSSFGDGIERSDGSASVILDHSNSPLENLNPSGRSVNITALRTSGNNLWVTNYGATKPLHVFKNNEWQSFTLCCSARFPTDLVIDLHGNVWTIISPDQGGGVHILDPDNSSSVFLTETIGSGALPDQMVRTITIDRDGYVWIGTDQGAAYFISPGTDAIKPIFENRFLLHAEKINAIEVDGGNRKWIGTEHGVWLFDPAGERLFHNFTVENSPLLSDTIIDIAINNSNGEVFFATQKGIVSYRADATTGNENFDYLKIFPNPVTSAFTGTVGISGLATDAIVKITDVSGKLIWQTKANGGTASWNVRGYDGRRAATGIYLVFAATEDGSEKKVGKIAVVE